MTLNMSLMIQKLTLKKALWVFTSTDCKITLLLVFEVAVDDFKTFFILRVGAEQQELKRMKTEEHFH